MINGIIGEVVGGILAPHPINAVPANCVPADLPSAVEPVSGQLIRKKTGPKPLAKSLRMELMLDFVSGRIPADKEKRMLFIKRSELTTAEKAYLVKHECFKDLYDARLFDMFMGLEDPTKEALKLMNIVALRVGLAKPMQMNVKNLQMNNNSKGATTIKVEKAK